MITQWRTFFNKKLVKTKMQEIFSVIMAKKQVIPGKANGCRVCTPAAFAVSP